MEEERTYALTRSAQNLLMWPVLTVPLFGAMSIGMASSGQSERALLAAGAALLAAGGSVYSYRYRPWQVTITEVGVLLDARARQEFIGWDQLISVRLTRNRTNTFLVWQRTNGPRVRGSAGFADLHRMLTDIEQRSPGTEVNLS